MTSDEIRQIFREELSRIGLTPMADITKIAKLSLEEQKAYWKSRRMQQKKAANG